MANNDLLVQSTLSTVPKQADVRKQTEAGSQQPPVPVKNVPEQDREPELLSNLARVDEARQEQAEALRDKVAKMNDYMQNFNRSLKFSVDEGSGDTIVKVIDSETEKVVRQIPSEEVLDARNAIEKFRGLLLEVKV
jgi:flagellar protein FlaG